MLDHALVDLIATIRRGFEAALLEPQAVEERFLVDVFLGDVSFETSYSLPGEGDSPRVWADLKLEWPTWSQSAYRSWSIGETPDALPEVVVEIALRVERLKGAPDPDTILAVLPESSPSVAGEPLERTAPMIEQVFDNDGAVPSCAVEVCYEGTWTLDESVLDDPATLDADVAALGTWVASTLVRLCDLKLEFLPPDEAEQT